MKRISLNLFCILFFYLTIVVPNTGRCAVVPAEFSPWFVDMNRFSASAHGTFSCEECHGDMKKGNKEHPDSADSALLMRNATRMYDYARCKSCHRPSYERYKEGVHAKALKKERPNPGFKSEIEKAPTCGDCHSSHYGKSHLSRVETGRQMVRICGSCHQAQKETYLENFHGKSGVNLGNPKSAFCTDCHGAHRCESLKTQAAVLSACKKCHPSAGKGFAQVVIHPTTKGLAGDDTAKRSRIMLIQAVTIIMAVLAILVVAFFYGHSFVWILRELHERMRKHR